MNRHAHKGSYLCKAVYHHYEDQDLSDSKLLLLYLYRRECFKRKSENKTSQDTYIERIHKKIDRCKVRVVKLGAYDVQSG